MRYFLGLALGLSISGCQKDAKEAVRDFLDSRPALDLSETDLTTQAAAVSHPTGSIMVPYIYMYNLENRVASGCPTVEETPGENGMIVRTYRGGCHSTGEKLSTPDDDTTFEGEIRFVADAATILAANHFEITFDWEEISGRACGDGKSYTPALQRFRGTYVFNRSDDKNFEVYDMFYRVDADSVDEVDCTKMQTSYATDYHVEMAYSGADTDGDKLPDEFLTFNGGGEMAFNQLGHWEIQIEDLKHGLSDALGKTEEGCPEGLTGSLSLYSRGHVAKVVSDGAKTCTAESCSPWFLDGEAQGEVCGFGGCQLRMASHTTLPFSSLILALLGGLVLRRVRRSNRQK